MIVTKHMTFDEGVFPFMQEKSMEVTLNDI